MTVAEVCQLLAALPPAAPLCFTDGEFLREVAQLDLVAAAGNSDGFVAVFDGATEGTVRVVRLT